MITTALQQKKIDILAANKQLAEANLAFFIKLVAPKRALGALHHKLIKWWNKPNSNPHQLVLLPRGHQKSTMIAFRAAWEITKNPATTIFYLSATAGLAEKQLRLIKDILTSDIYRVYWPEMVNEDEGKREKWSTTEICVDHPLRRQEGIRDSTVFIGGLTTNVVGLHCDICIIDDVVVKDNSTTADGRRKVAEAYSLLSSIENPNAYEWVVGTRYNGDDLYSSLLKMEENIYDVDGNELETRPVYEVFEATLENSPNRDGTGEYLWPVQKRTDGKEYGFDIAIRAKKYATYLDKLQFYAQYYNDPTDPENIRIEPDNFRYYDKKYVERRGGDWWFKDRRLNIYAGIDFAWTMSKRSDYTALVIIGVDDDKNILILDIDRFKTDKISVMWDHVYNMHYKWGIKTLRAETNVGQKLIVEQFKDHMKDEGAFINIDENYRTRHTGKKMERNMTILQPRYAQGLIYHYDGGNCQVLESELVQTHPAHDDIEDALASAIEISRPPIRKKQNNTVNKIEFHERFGGIT